MASQGLMLSTVGVLITTVVTGLLIYYLSEWTRLDIGLTLPMSMLLAATVSSTDSASVFNLLRTQRIGLKHRLRPLLELESGSNDPMAYVLTVALVDMIVTAGEFSGMALATKIIGQLAVGDCQQKGKNVLDETVRKVGLNRKARLTESSYLCTRNLVR